MKINKAEFITSAYDNQGYPEHNWPEIALVGRSNVGKSSLLNKFTNRKKLARTSTQPGRTQSLNFYNINDNFFIVDLPGYGFARVSKKMREEWAVLIEDYLYHRPNLQGIIQIVDARHKPTGDDKTMYNWIKEMDLPTLVVATKVDKISRGQRSKQKKLIKKTLNIESEKQMVFFSALTGEGKNHINNYLVNLVYE